METSTLRNVKVYCGVQETKSPPPPPRPVHRPLVTHAGPYTESLQRIHILVGIFQHLLAGLMYDFSPSVNENNRLHTQPISLSSTNENRSWLAIFFELRSPRPFSKYK